MGGTDPLRLAHTSQLSTARWDCRGPGYGHADHLGPAQHRATDLCANGLAVVVLCRDIGVWVWLYHADHSRRDGELRTPGADRCGDRRGYARADQPGSRDRSGVLESV